MSIKYSEILTADEILSAGDDDIIVVAIVDGISSTGYTTKAIKKLNLIPNPLFTSLTTTGASGDAATLISGILNIPTPVIPAVPFTSLTTTGTTGASTLVAGVLNIPTYGGGIVDSVTGLDTDFSDPANPIVNIAVDGVTITGSGTSIDPLVGTGDGIYGGNGTIPAAVIATLTDNIELASNLAGEAAFTLSNTGLLGRSKIKIAAGTESMSLYTTVAQGHIISSNDPNGLHIVSTTANTTISTLAGSIVDITAVGDIQIVGSTDARLLNTDFLNDRVRIGSTAAFPVKMIVQNTNPLDEVFVAVDSIGVNSMQFGENGVLSVNNIISVGNASPSSASRIQTLGDIEITQTIAWYYLGDPTTDGSWRFGANGGADFLHQKRELGVWVTKQTIVA
jgi:hypothetical protein